MSSLEDKILGLKKENYCSSSSNSDNEDDYTEDGAPISEPQELSSSLPEPRKWEGISSNTGPKGVIKDWQRFKQLEVEQKKEQYAERIQLMKKLSLTCSSKLDDEKDKKEEDELSELMSDKFLEQYRKKRMNEMLSCSNQLPKFGILIDLKDGSDFIEAIDNENKAVSVIIHIYEINVPECNKLNKILLKLSKKYCEVKFCKIISSDAGMSKHFKVGGVPAILVYKAGLVIGNFVHVTDELGDEFYESDVENFLIEHGMIQDKSCFPKILSQSQDKDEDSDTS
uniref:Phosducin domain-containing protein n=1 Tax=Clastoptera arizonana TaxID=38151 RepID=A0A1B6CQV0_9HEMI